MGELGRRLAKIKGDFRSSSFLVQRLSIDIQRGNVPFHLRVSGMSYACNICDIIIFLDFMYMSYDNSYCAVIK